jgi:hypothetical protein
MHSKNGIIELRIPIALPMPISHLTAFSARPGFDLLPMVSNVIFGQLASQKT